MGFAQTVKKTTCKDWLICGEWGASTILPKFARGL